MTKHARNLSFAILSFVILYTSCTKINEGTELGGDLIPAVDNVTTFETSLDVTTDNRNNYFPDSTKLSFYDEVALGVMNDPEFGATKANIYFGFFAGDTLSHPFIVKKKDSITIDSVVLSLAYVGNYGDSNATQNISVFEISQSAGFKDSAFYKFTHQPEFTVGNQIGSATYKNANLDDSIWVKNAPDTNNFKLANLLRIRLNNSFGDKIKNIDSNIFRSYELFHTIFPGLAIRANSGNALSYFDLTSFAKSRLLVYYKAKINGRDSASTASFFHYLRPATTPTINPPNFINNKANIIQRTPGGGYNTYGATGTVDPVLHIQSAPGSVAYISIPALSTFQNKVIHRAELIVPRIPSAGDATFATPELLFMDHITASSDTGYTFYRDASFTTSGYDFNSFGGQLKADGNYRFNITRYVQNIVTRGEPNDTLRLYAPFRTNVSDRNYLVQTGYQGLLMTIPVASKIAYGRVVVGGGNNPDPAKRMRLRIIYSNL